MATLKKNAFLHNGVMFELLIKARGMTCPLYHPLFDECPIGVFLGIIKLYEKKQDERGSKDKESLKMITFSM